MILYRYIALFLIDMIEMCDLKEKKYLKISNKILYINLSFSGKITTVVVCKGKMAATSCRKKRLVILQSDGTAWYYNYMIFMPL